MPDIMMCNDGDCPSADTCYRFTALPAKHDQVYFARSPRDPQAPRCKEYKEETDGSQ